MFLKNNAKLLLALQKRYSLYTENQITILLSCIRMNVLNRLIELIDQSIDENADNILTNGNIIASWYKQDVDEYREILQKWHEWIWNYKQELIELTQIKTLRIKYTNNSWYFIELPKNQINNIPDDFIHKQTLVSAHRYTTPKLQEFQSKSDSANTNLSELEYGYFLEIRNNVMSHFNYLYNLSRNIEELDFYTNAASISLKNNYITPQISTKYSIDIQSGKHPVMMSVVDDFISNNLNLSKKEFVNVITWPNMWWKSTFLRQNALLILQAHIWFDIPAKSAIIPITDRIFSRVGSWDNLFLWQSTFMVEMQEIAYILRNSTNKSFVIIDEIWRGTSTYDWMSLAWSILKHNHEEINAKTLFATHYHEIIDFSSSLSWVKNYSVAVWENSDSIVFLRKIIPWWIKKSYGIEVAWLAWIPKPVLQEAKTTLLNLHNKDSFKQLSFWVASEAITNTQSDKDDEISQYEELMKHLKDININNITPIQALTELQKFQEQVKKMK